MWIGISAIITEYNPRYQTTNLTEKRRRRWPELVETVGLQFIRMDPSLPSGPHHPNKLLNLLTHGPLEIISILSLSIGFHMPTVVPSTEYY